MLFCLSASCLGAQILTLENQYTGCFPTTLSFYTIPNKAPSDVWTITGGPVAYTSSLDTASYIFSTAGTYEVKVGSLTKSIEIYSKPNPSFNIGGNGLTEGCLPFNFTLNDITAFFPGITGIKYTWTFSDGSSAIGKTINHTIANLEGFSDVSLFVETNPLSCNANFTQPNYLKMVKRPIAKISGTPTEKCSPPLTVNISNSTTTPQFSNLSWNWNWANPTPGSSNSLSLSPITFNTFGVFKIFLTATNQYGCKSTDSIEVKVKKIDTLEIDYDSVQCIDAEQDIVMLNHTSDYKYNLMASDPNFRYVNSSNDVFTIRYLKRDATITVPITITKTAVSDPSCTITRTIMVTFLKLRPFLQLKQDAKCAPILRDTILATNRNQYVDSIFYELIFRDKYNYRIAWDSIKGDKDDTMPIVSIDVPDLDSFYRKGPNRFNISIGYKNTLSKCRVDTVFNFGKNNLFYAFLAADSLQGCAPFKAKIRTMSYVPHEFDSVQYIIQPGNTVIRNKVVSPPDMDTFLHTLNNPGRYRIIAVTKSRNGCVDTTNPLFFDVAGKTTPLFTISNIAPCIGYPITLTASNSSSFDQTYFVTQDGRSYNCASQSVVNWQKFDTVGQYTIYLYGVKDGCRTVSSQTINVSGPYFYLEKDFKCSRRDSVYFSLQKMSDVNPASYTWNFGDGSTVSNTPITNFKKHYPNRGDYYVSVKATNTNGCKYADSVLVHIRKVKADFSPTFFCKIFNLDTGESFAYYNFKPTGSLDAGYVSNYAYTWQVQDYRTGKKSPFVSIPEPAIPLLIDSQWVTLTARDTNGCTDTIRKMVVVDTPKIKVTLQKPLCYFGDTLFFSTTLGTNFPVFSQKWTLLEYEKIPNTTSRNVVSLVTDTTTLHKYILKDPKRSNWFEYIYTIVYQNNICPVTKITDTFSFFRDTTFLSARDSICMNSANQISAAHDQTSSFKYSWIVNDVLQPVPDTNYFLLKKFPTPMPGQEIKLVRQHRTNGCLDTMTRNIFVGQKPVITLTNSFASSDRCTPLTVVSYTNTSTGIPSGSISHQWHQKGRTVPFSLNPSSIPLINKLDTIYAIIRTTYGCRDTYLIANRFYNPIFKMQMDKTTICRGDSITFSLDTIDDVDSLIMSFGDGNSFRKGFLWDSTRLKVGYRYTNYVVGSDSFLVSTSIFARNGLCAKARDTFVVVKDPKPRFHLNNGVDTAYCYDKVNLFNTSPRGDYFFWKLGDGNVSNSRDTQDYFYPRPGSYEATLYAYLNPLQCVDSFKKRIILHPIPKLTAYKDTVCLGDTLHLAYTDTMPGNKIFIQPDPNKLNPIFGSPIKVLVNQTTDFKIISETNKGCLDSVAVRGMVVNPAQQLNLDTIIVSGKRVVLPIIYDSFMNYNWTPPLDSPSCTNCSYPEIQVITSSKYELLVKDKRGCFERKMFFKIDVYPDILVRVPTAFSPNGDGFNDILFARGSGIKKLLDFKIYNRLGQLLFMTTDENLGWDGTYKGVDQNTDSYFYTYRAEAFIPGKIVSGEGNFMLLR